MRRNLVLGIIGVIVFFGVGGASLWWLIAAVGGRGAARAEVVGEITSALVGVDGKHVTVLGAGYACGTPELKVQQSPAAVRLTYVVATDPGVACQLGLRAAGVAAVLDSPLGARPLLDPSGRSIPHFDARELRPVAVLPGGYRLVPSDTGGLVPSLSGATVTRAYTDGTGTMIDVTESTAPLRSTGHEIATLIVGGHPAVAYTVAGLGVELRWSDGAVYLGVSAPKSAVAQQVAAGLYR